MKVCFKLPSPDVLINLPFEPITCKKLKITKIKFNNTSETLNALLININDISSNRYYDGIIMIPYSFCCLIPNGNPQDNKLVMYADNIKENYDVDYENDYSFTYFRITIYNDFGELETSINNTNPLILEIQFLK
jgi:Na+/pantothenate symporter